jgi:hypothetical protein
MLIDLAGDCCINGRFGLRSGIWIELNKQLVGCHIGSQHAALLKRFEKHQSAVYFSLGRFAQLTKVLAE